MTVAPPRALGLPSGSLVRGRGRGAQLRRLYDMEAVGLAATALLLGCPHREVLGAARPQVTRGTRAVTTAQGAQRTVPEHARGLLRAWAGQALWPWQWPDDAAVGGRAAAQRGAAARSGASVVGAGGVARAQRPGLRGAGLGDPVGVQAHRQLVGERHRGRQRRLDHSHSGGATTLTSWRAALSISWRSTGTPSSAEQDIHLNALRTVETRAG